MLASIPGALAATWPMVSASYAPLLALLLTRLAGASALAAANVGLAAAIVLRATGRGAELAAQALTVVEAADTACLQATPDPAALLAMLRPPARRPAGPPHRPAAPLSPAALSRSSPRCGKSWVRSAA